jgi:hypothetical protein
MTTWRDKQAAMPKPILKALDAWKETEGRGDTERMECAIDAYEDAEKECQQCDEPGCTRTAGCGYPVPNGYRRTCHEHIDKESP